METTVEIEGLLIDCVREYTFLYDKGHGSFKNNLRKQLAWDEIAGKLNTDVDNCMRLWKRARERYVRERKGVPSGSAAVLRWPNFIRMSFLDKHVQTRKRICNVPEPSGGSQDFHESECMPLCDETTQDSHDTQESNETQQSQDTQESHETVELHETLGSPDVRPGSVTGRANMFSRERTFSPTPRKRKAVEPEWQSAIANALGKLATSRSPAKESSSEEILGQLITMTLKEEKDEELKIKKKKNFTRLAYASLEEVEQVLLLLN